MSSHLTPCSAPKLPFLFTGCLLLFQISFRVPPPCLLSRLVCCFKLVSVIMEPISAQSTLSNVTPNPFVPYFPVRGQMYEKPRHSVCEIHNLNETSQATLSGAFCAWTSWSRQYVLSIRGCVCACARLGVRSVRVTLHHI